ncbi:MAG: DUF2807 domain-containing protein [Myxococcales bacterium]|nr:DUF2807 domain-containing protein [Myxococcales bacterium]
MARVRFAWWVLLLGALAPGCICGYPQTIVGNGVPENEARLVGAFKRARFEGGITATVLPGQRNVKLTADSNLLQYLETYVESGEVFVARVRPDVTLAPVVGLKVEVTNDVVEGLELQTGSRAAAAASPVTLFRLTASGGSSGTVTGLASTQLEVSATGASTAIATGQATSVNAVAQDDSVVHAEEVTASSVSVTGNNRAHLTVRASAQVTGTLTGGSTLVVYGGGTVTVDKSADSTIEVK